MSQFITDKRVETLNYDLLSLGKELKEMTLLVKCNSTTIADLLGIIQNQNKSLTELKEEVQSLKTELDTLKKGSQNQITVECKTVEEEEIKPFRHFEFEESWKHLPEVKFPDGQKQWYKDGKKYMTEFPDGQKQWYKDGKKYMTEFPDGTKQWYKNGKLHRDSDLPTVEFPNGIKQWYKDGELHRDGDLPAVEMPNGYKAWYFNGQRHRETDLPAREHINGMKEWWKYGKLHREGDLPAIINSDGTREYWINGELLGKE